MQKYILNMVQLTYKFKMWNFEDNLRVGLVQHKDYATQEQLLMSWKYLWVTPVVQFCTCK